MSLINKMLQDLDKRHAGDSGSKTLTQHLRPVKVARKDWTRIMWEIGAGLIVAAGWAGWVYYQIAPRSVVTDLAMRMHLERARLAAARQVPATQPPPPAVVPVAPVAAPAAAPQLPPAAAAAVPTEPAHKAAEAVNVDMLKLATEITTPLRKKPSAEPRPAPRRAAPAAPAPRSVDHGISPRGVVARGALTEESPGSIDKRIHPSTPAARAENDFREATQLLNQGRVAEAIDGYAAALRQDPGHAAARQALVSLLLENRRVGEAQQFLQEGLNLYPERTAYAILLARIQVDRGDVKGAHELLRKYAGGAANDAEYHAFDAALLQRLGRHKEAVASYQAALKLAPRTALWLMGMGISLQAENNAAAALDAYRRAKAAGGLSPALIAFVDQRMKQLQ